MVERLLATAAAEIGVKESPPGSNRVKYWDEIYPAYSGSAWCVCFAIWSLRKIGFDKKDAPDIYGITSLLSWAMAQKRYVSRDAVKPGDIIGFDMDDNDRTLEDRHAAILERVSGNALHTIDGNVSDQVKRCSRPRSSCIGGYRPDYSKLAAAFNTYVVRDGDTLSDIAVKFYGKGQSGRWRDIADANKLTGSVVRAGMVLTIPK